MAWVYTKETGFGRTGDLNTSLARTYTRKFLVKMSLDTDGALAVMLATGIPRIGDVYATATENDLGAWCQSVKPRKRDDAPGLWEVEAEYSSQSRNDPTQFQENPLLRPARVRLSFAKYQKVAERDRLGKRIINSARVPFDPPVEVDESRPILVVTRNEAAVSPALVLDYQDAVNIDAFFGAAPGVAKILSIEVESAYEGLQGGGTFSYVVVTYQIEFRAEGWIFRPMDRGKCELVNGRLQAIVDNQGMPIGEPVPLDGVGRDLRRAQTTLSAAIATPQDLTFSVTDGTVFQAATPFDVIIDSEEIRIDFVGPLQITVAQRGANGTTAAAHVNGSTVKMLPYFLEFETHKRRLFAPLGLP